MPQRLLTRASKRGARVLLELLTPLDYRVGKVTRLGIEFYSRWDFELESFRESNYLACRGDWVERFPQVAWRAGVAWCHAHLGNEEDARRWYDPMAANDFSDIPRDA